MIYFTNSGLLLPSSDGNLKGKAYIPAMIKQDAMKVK